MNYFQRPVIEASGVAWRPNLNASPGHLPDRPLSRSPRAPALPADPLGSGDHRAADAGKLSVALPQCRKSRRPSPAAALLHPGARPAARRRRPGLAAGTPAEPGAGDRKPHAASQATSACQAARRSASPALAAGSECGKMKAKPPAVERRGRMSKSARPSQHNRQPRCGRDSGSSAQPPAEIAEFHQFRRIDAELRMFQPSVPLGWPMADPRSVAPGRAGACAGSACCPRRAPAVPRRAGTGRRAGRRPRVVRTGQDGRRRGSGRTRRSRRHGRTPHVPRAG